MQCELRSVALAGGLIFDLPILVAAEAITLLKDIYPGPPGSQPAEIKAANGLIYFSAEHGFTGYEPWASDVHRKARGY